MTNRDIDLCTCGKTREDGCHEAEKAIADSSLMAYYHPFFPNPQPTPPDIPTIPHTPFPKIPRHSKNKIIITEKIDGTNAVLFVDEQKRVFAGSRNRWVTPTNDNYGFASWVHDHASELSNLGNGIHYGEWYGIGIGRGYGIDHRRFALFNTSRPKRRSHLV